LIGDGQEIQLVIDDWLAPFDDEETAQLIRYTRAIEAALLKKLAAGYVMPDHVGKAYLHKTRDPRPDYDTFYRHHVIAAIAATRVAALEEAAACAYDEVQYMSDFDKADIVRAQIRALIGAKT
jgi:hypothetical protein